VLTWAGQAGDTADESHEQIPLIFRARKTKAPIFHPGVGTQYTTRYSHRATAEVPRAFLCLKLAGSRVFSLGGSGAEEGQTTARIARSRTLTPHPQPDPVRGGKSWTVSSFPSSWQHCSPGAATADSRGLTNIKAEP